MENQETIKNKILLDINNIFEEISYFIKGYQAELSNIKSSQTDFINNIPNKIKESITNTNKFISELNENNIKINKIENLNNEIKNNINSGSLTHIPENQIMEFYYNLESTFSIFKNNRSYLSELSDTIIDFNKNISIDDLILESEENKVIININAMLDTIIDSYKNIKNQLTIIEESFKNLLIDLNQMISFNEEIKIKEDFINNNFSKKINSEKAKILSQFNNEFNNIFNEIQNKFNNLELDIKTNTESTNLLKDSTEKGLSKLASLNNRIQKIELHFTSSLEKKLYEVDLITEKAKLDLNYEIDLIRKNLMSDQQKILTDHNEFIGLIEKAGIYELTQNYNKKSNEEKIEYTTYRKYTAWSIIAAILSTLLIFILAFVEHYFSPIKDQTNYILLISRLSISVMFFVLALYLSKRASKHYECYQENHRTFLQLAALEPFMARMTPEEQKEIRKGLIPCYFNQGSEGKFAAKGDEVSLPTNFSEKLDKIIDAVKEVKISRSEKNLQE